jgi:hypothetical protein
MKPPLADAFLSVFTFMLLTTLFELQWLYSISWDKEQVLE